MRVLTGAGCLVVALLAAGWPSPPGAPSAPGPPPRAAPADTVVALTTHPADDRRASCSPDGRRVAFESNRAGNWDLYVLDRGSGSVRPLTRHPAADRKPSWAPRSRRIAFQSDRTGTEQIHTVDPATREVTRITDGPEAAYFPAWSPDDRWIAFSRGPPDSASLHLVEPDTGTLRRLTADGSGDLWPAWSGNEEILFFSRRRGNDDIFRLRLDTDTLWQVTRHGAHDFTPAGSNERPATVAFASTRAGPAQIHVLEPWEEPPVRITDELGRATEPTWCGRRSRTLVFTSDRHGSDDLFLIELPERE